MSARSDTLLLELEEWVSHAEKYRTNASYNGFIGVGSGEMQFKLVVS
jgi:hypothetical protein